MPLELESELELESRVEFGAESRAKWTYAFKYFGAELDNGGGRSGRSDGRRVTSIWIEG